MEMTNAQECVVWVQDRDGEDLFSETFDSLDELLQHWPYAELVIDNHEGEGGTFEAWVGGRA